MKNIIFLKNISLLVLLTNQIIHVTQAQQYLPDKQQPIETICKNSYYWNGFTGPHGNIVGETYHPSCSGDGKNAWLTKFLEAEDTLCTMQSTDFVTSNYSWQLIKQVYDVVDTVWSVDCPNSFDENNAQVLHIKAPSYGGLAPQGYVRTSYLDLFELQGADEWVCDHATHGYIVKGYGYPIDKCKNPLDNSGLLAYGKHIKQPSSIETEVNYSSAFPISYIAFKFNYLYYDILNGNLWMADIKRPTLPFEEACKTTFTIIPTGYRVVAQTLFSNQCAELSYTIKKLSDAEEIICSAVPSVLGQDIPVTYIKVDDIYNESCPASAETNAWKLHRITEF